MITEPLADPLFLEQKQNHKLQLSMQRMIIIIHNSLSKTIFSPTNFTNSNQFDSANYYLKKALNLALELKHERYQYAILNSIGIVNRKTGHYLEAIESYVKALAFAEKIGTRGQVASILMNIGKTFILPQKNTNHSIFQC